MNLGANLAIRYGQESAYVQERRKWEQRPVMIDSQWVEPQKIDGVMRAGFMDGTYVQPLSVAEGGRGEYVHQEYPKMLYRARRADGGPQIDSHLVVESEREESVERMRGWHPTQEGAIEAIHAEDREFARLAAERHYHERHMSDGAQREARAAEEEASGHLPAVPETPIRRGPGRPKKSEHVSA